MGIDIHVIVEAPDPDTSGEWWDAIAEVYWHRSTQLFGIIAGVRGGNALFEPRGLPSPCSWRVEDWQGEDLHSFTWLTRDELLQVRRVYREKGPEWYDTTDKLVHPGLARTIRLMGPDSRAVFGFDG